MTEYDQELLLALWRLQEAHAASAPPDQINGTLTYFRL